MELGTLWAVILLCHQFTGVVATVGALATVLSARPARLPRAVWPRLGAGLLLGVLVLWAWPYYDFFALMGAGAGLESVHRELYRDLPARFGLVLLGVDSFLQSVVRGVIIVLAVLLNVTLSRKRGSIEES